MDIASSSSVSYPKNDLLDIVYDLKNDKEEVSRTFCIYFETLI